METEIAPGQLWLMSNGSAYLVVALDVARSELPHKRCWLVLSEEDREVFSWSELTMGEPEGDRLIARSGDVKRPADPM
jgi:hypothetical protein